MNFPFFFPFFEKRSENVEQNSEKVTENNSNTQAREVTFLGNNYIHVNELTAMQTTAVMACVRLIAETVASLPQGVYKRLKNGGKERTNHYLHDIFNVSPNGTLTSFQFKEMMMAHVLLWGNCYAEIEWDGSGKIIALHPIPPDKVQVKKIPNTREIYYEVKVENQQKKLPPYAMFHVAGLGFDGLKGFSPIQMAKRTIGLTIAAEQFGENFYKNGTNTGGFFTADSSLSDAAYKRLKADLDEKYQGLGNAHRAMLLEEGLKFQSIGIPPDDAQFLETRKFQVNEIARLFRVPPHMIGDLDKATFSNIEQQSISFVMHTIRPWLERWEQVICLKLLSETERKRLFTKYIIEGLLRGDTISRYQAYNIGWGKWLTTNEIREMEDRNPTEGGDTLMYPLNMAPTKSLEGGEKNEGEGNSLVSSNGTDSGDKGAGTDTKD